MAKKKIMAGNNKSIMAADKHIGSRIRIRRLELKMSQERLGDELGITFQQIQKYEKGANRVSGSRLCQMANALGVSEAYFFEGAPGGSKHSNGAGHHFNEVMTTRDGQDLIEAFHKIKSKTRRRQLVDLATTFAGME
jgi:transcriptional regulator with XRE-family HTH domain